MNYPSLADLPPVTDANRRQAFMVIAPKGRNYTAAMADPVLRRVIEAKAACIRTEYWQRTQMRSMVPVKRVRLGSDGHPMGWCTQMATGPLVPRQQAEIFNQPTQP
jgi:hypothetical protein